MNELERCQKTLEFCRAELGLTADQAAWWLFTTGLSLAEYMCNENREELEGVFSDYGAEVVRRGNLAIPPA